MAGPISPWQAAKEARRAKRWDDPVVNQRRKAHENREATRRRHARIAAQVAEAGDNPIARQAVSLIKKAATTS